MRPPARFYGLAGAGSLLVATACAGSPDSTFEAYRRALARGEVRRVAALHAQTGPLPSDPERLSAFREQHPATWEAAVERLREPVAAVRQTAEVRLTSGATVTLVLEDGQWRVLEGAMWVPAADTPESALLTLFFGLEAGDLAAVRSVMPQSQRAQFATDRALRNHLGRIRARVERARERIGDVRPGLARITGDKATLPYEGARQVRFVWEAKRWRVLDVE